MIRAVVFDLDGTLLDSAPDILASLERAAARAGIQGEGRFAQARVGPPVAEIVAQFGGSLSAAQQADIVAAFRFEYDASPMLATKPYVGAASCLARLRVRGIAPFVATNKPSAPTLRLLERWFPGAFLGVVTIDAQPGRRLSKNEMLGVLAERHALAPATSVMVGDSAADLRAARAMGWRSVAAWYGYGAVDELRTEAPTWGIHSIAELPAILEIA